MSSPVGRLPANTMYVRRSHGVGLTVFIIVTSGFFAAIARATAPKPFALAVMLMMLTILAWCLRPMVGLCATVFFALVADNTTSPWYPFLKGFSSVESIMFVSNALIVSPYELVLIASLLALFGRYLVLGTWELSIGRLAGAVAAFTAFVLLALAHGYVTGANTQIALFEARPFIAFFTVYILVSSVCHTLADYRHVMWAVLAAIGVHSLIAFQYISTRNEDQLKLTESLLDHGAAMRMDVLIVFVIAAWLFPGTSRRLRFTTTLILVPVFTVYLSPSDEPPSSDSSVRSHCSQWCCSGTVDDCSSGSCRSPDSCWPRTSARSGTPRPPPRSRRKR
jgi:hypothetical protein